MNLQHYQLPISKYMNMKTRQVLTVNQVFEVICNYSECKDWEKAFIDTLPKRKGAKIKLNNEELN
jgi:tRNA (guanine9-N1)-methyltransferase